jgi:hypothetical protein
VEFNRKLRRTILKRFLFVLLKLFLAFTIILLLVSAAFLLKPQWFVNNWTAGWALNYADILVGRLNVRSEAPSLLKHRYIVTTGALNYQTETTDLEWDRSSFEVVIDFRQRKFERIGPSRVTGLRITQAVSKERNPPPEDHSWVMSVLETVSQTVFHTVEIDLEKFQLVDGKRVVSSARGSLNLSGLNLGKTERLDIAMTNLVGFPIKRARLSADFPGHILESRGDFAIKADSVLASGELLRAQVFLKDGNWFEGDTKLSGGKAGFFAAWQGDVEPGLFEGKLKISLSSKIALDAPACAVKANWGKTLDDAMELTSNCNVQFRYQVPTGLMSKLFPNHIPFQFSGTTKLSGKRDDKILQVDAKVNVNQTHTGPFSMSGNATWAGSSPLKNFDANRFALQFDAAVAAQKFETLVAELHETNWAIPAPFNQLAGSASCRIKGKYIRESGAAPLQCGINLKSEEQAYVLSSNGQLKLEESNNDWQPSVTLRVLIESLKFRLPDMRIGQPLPQIFGDRRIVRSNSPAKARIDIKYDIGIETAGPKSIELYSNLVPNPIPLQISVRAKSGQAVTGDIRLAEFSFEALRREGIVEELKVAIAAKAEDQILTGRVRFPADDYVIFMDIFGSAAKPGYRFRSQPPLSEREIIAVILFGDVPESLDADRLSSVDDTQAAIAGGALELASMYYLATTPVESVSYDPATKSVAARVRLGKGLSLKVGRDLDSETQQVGLRQRLGGGWSIETTATHDEVTDADRGVAMLKWSRRY